MISDGIKINEVKVDGGMSNNNWLMQFTSNILNKPILRPVVQETTALGVAMITLLALERFNNIEDINDAWKLDRIFKFLIIPEPCLLHLLIMIHHRTLKGYHNLSVSIFLNLP